MHVIPIWNYTHSSCLPPSWFLISASCRVAIMSSPALHLNSANDKVSLMWEAHTRTHTHTLFHHPHSPSCTIVMLLKKEHKYKKLTHVKGSVPSMVILGVNWESCQQSTCTVTVVCNCLLWALFVLRVFHVLKGGLELLLILLSPHTSYALESTVRATISEPTSVLSFGANLD